MKKDEKITLANICGYKEEKAAVKNIITLLNGYDKYAKQGVNIPRGLILQGPPGTGKTLFAKAIAGECNYKFYTAFSSDFEEQSLDTLKKVFKEAEDNSEKTKQPSLIYIDEIDKLTYTDSRGDLDSAAREVIRFLLQKLDETKLKNRILIIASTNNYRRIPRALLRSGRFDKKILIDLPDAQSRKEILDLYINNHPLFKNISTDALALKTQGMSGADLKTLINNTMLEYITNKKELELDDFIKIIHEMNFETIGKTWNDTKNALEVLAHEVGHALIAYKLTGKCGTVSALKYGDTAGNTDLSDSWEDDDYRDLPEIEEELSDEELTNAKDMFNDIMISLGGLVGEDIYLHQKSVGVSSDLGRIGSVLNELTACGVFGFKYGRGRQFYDAGGSDRYFEMCYRFHLKQINKYYRKAKHIIKKNKILGLYLIDEVHKNNDVLSNNELLKRIKHFEANKKAYNNMYKHKKIKDLEDKKDGK